LAGDGIAGQARHDALATVGRRQPLQGFLLDQQLLSRHLQHSAVQPGIGHIPQPGSDLGIGGIDIE
jgi:hypothetical protein